MDVYKKAVYARIRKDIFTYLKMLSLKGIRVTIEGYVFPITKAAEILSVNEEVCYMADYLSDDTGRLVEVRYDRVTL